MTAQFHQDGRFGPIKLVYLGHFFIEMPISSGKMSVMLDIYVSITQDVINYWKNNTLVSVLGNNKVLTAFITYWKKILRFQSDGRYRILSAFIAYWKNKYISLLWL
jgi:hypothetical protein